MYDLSSLDAFDRSAVEFLFDTGHGSLRQCLLDEAGRLRERAKSTRLGAQYADRQSEYRRELEDAHALDMRADKMPRLADGMGDGP